MCLEAPGELGAAKGLKGEELQLRQRRSAAPRPLPGGEPEPDDALTKQKARQTRLQEARPKANTAVGEGTAAGNCDDVSTAAPGLSKCVDTMEDWLPLMSLMAYAKPSDPSTVALPDGLAADNDVLITPLTALITKASEQETVAQPAATEAIAEVLKTELGKCEKFAKHLLVMALLAEHRWSAADGKFSGNITVAPMLSYYYDVRAYAIARFKLQDALGQRRDSGKTLPFVAKFIEAIEPFYFLEIIGRRVGLCLTELDIKTLPREIDSAKELQDKFTKWIEGSCNEVAAAVDRWDEKQTNAKISQQKKAKAEEGARQKKAAEAKVKAAQHKESTAVPTLLFDATNDVVRQIKTYDDEAEYKKAVEKSEVNATAPFMIKTSETLAGLSNERSIRAAMGVFRIQLPGSAMFTAESRGHGPCLADMVDAPKELENTILDKTFKQLLMFGQDTTYNNCSLERQGSAALCYQVTGSRRVCVFSYRALLDYSVQANSVRGASQDLFEWAADLIKGIQVNEQLELVKTPIWRATIPQGSYARIPMGPFALQRSVGENLVAGFGASVVTLNKDWGCA
ncbi:unnamed protein product [Prorocentrum cordatum]|uniref:Uncharacterized protein n=1 Tax=Prorocentrum cordatum TaxID=2364126 RepID=A0ABN9RXW5_9DINO|nr:unnamed protein product [Polarella glacialis]